MLQEKKENKRKERKKFILLSGGSVATQRVYYCTELEREGERGKKHGPFGKKSCAWLKKRGKTVGKEKQKLRRSRI